MIAASDAVETDGLSSTNRYLRSTLAAVSCEASDLAHLGDRLQTLISEMLVAQSSSGVADLRDFQAIDLLVQRLHGLATFVEALASVTPTDWRVDAASAAAKVQLSDLARRLSGDSEDPDALTSKSPQYVGDLELFG